MYLLSTSSLPLPHEHVHQGGWGTRIMRRYLLLFYWHPVSEAFAPTNPGGAQALGKEFLTSAPQLIQGAIKFLQSNNPKGLNAPKLCWTLDLVGSIPSRPRPSPLGPSPWGCNEKISCYLTKGNCKESTQVFQRK